MKKNIIIGTRGSKLALWQARWVKGALSDRYPSFFFKIQKIKTKGDKILDVPLAKVGGKGLFIKEIENALLDGDIDIAVHSMKDMPSLLPDRLCIGAVPKRETPLDVLISRQNMPLALLPAGSVVGTSSLRRASQLLYKRPDLTVSSIRGNLDSRIKKLESGDFDAIVLAAAGVLRLNFESKITQYLDEEIMLPAVGQGALCIEVRKDDNKIKSMVSELDHYESRLQVMGERAFLGRLEGGCQVPIAAIGKVDKDRFFLTGLVADIEGKAVIKKRVCGALEECESLGVKLADHLLLLGAEQILESLKES